MAEQEGATRDATLLRHTDGADFWRTLRDLRSSGAFCDLHLLCGGGGVGVNVGASPDAAVDAGDGDGVDAGAAAASCNRNPVVRCHRLLLGAFSRVLRRSLRSLPPAEAPAVVHLPDHTFETVSHFVETLYASLAQGESIGSVDFSASSAILRTLGIADLRMPFFDLDEKEEEEGEDEEEYAEPRVKVVTKVEPSWGEFGEGVGDYVGHQGYKDGEEEEEDDDDEDEDEEDYKHRGGRKRRHRGYGYHDDDFIDYDEEDEEDYEFGFFDVEEEELAGLKSNGSAEAKKKKKNKGRKKRRKMQEEEGNEVTEVHEKVLSRSGRVVATMLTGRLDVAKDCAVDVRRDSEFMCLLGLRREEGDEGVLSAVPLAWSRVSEDEEREERTRERRGRKRRRGKRTKEEEAEEDEDGREEEDQERVTQYQDYCLALRSVFGLSELEVGFQPLVLERMEMGWYERKGIKNRLELMLEHVSRSPEELRNILEAGEAAAMARTETKKPFLYAGEERESLEVALELKASIPVAQLEAVALLTARRRKEDADAPSEEEGAGGGGGIAFEVRCLDVSVDGREKDARDAIKTIFDVWSLRRVDVNYVEPCLGVVRRYAELESVGDLVSACRDLLLDTDGSRRRELTSGESCCPVCAVTMPTRGIEELFQFEAHKRGHAFVSNYPCSCPESWSSEAEKSAHVQSEHLGGFERCEFCCEFYAKPEALERHVAREHRLVSCDDCGSTEMGTEGLRVHRALAHPDRKQSARVGGGGGGGGRPRGGRSRAQAGPVIETCHVCGKEFDKHANFHVHMRIHNTYTCDVCGKVIQGYNIMRAHKRKAHPDPNKVKAYPCEVCGKMMSSQMRMKEHILRIHAPDHERPHLCPDCGRGFARKGELEAHRNVVHIKSRPYACRFGCGEAFNHYATRGDHEKSKHGMRFPKTKTQDQMEKIFRIRQ